MGPTLRPLVLLLSIGALACGDGDATGTYRLESVGDEELPLVMNEDQDARFVLVSASLEISADSIVERSHFRHEIEGSDAVSDLHTTLAYAWQGDGSVLRGIPEAPPAIPMFEGCVEVGVFRLEDGGEILRRFDVERAGECRTPVDPFLSDLIYRRD